MSPSTSPLLCLFQNIQVLSIIVHLQKSMALCAIESSFNNFNWRVPDETTSKKTDFPKHTTPARSQLYYHCVFCTNAHTHKFLRNSMH